MVRVCVPCNSFKTNYIEHILLFWQWVVVMQITWLRIRKMQYWLLNKRATPSVAFSPTRSHIPPDNAVVSLWLVICVVLTFSHWLCLSLFGQHVMKIIDWMEMHTKTNRNTTRRNMIRTPQRRKWMRDREKNTIKWCMFIYEIRVVHEMANWIEFEHSNARASPFDKQILMDFQFSTEILYRIVIIFIIAYGIL